MKPGLMFKGKDLRKPGLLFKGGEGLPKPVAFDMLWVSTDCNAHRPTKASAAPLRAAGL
jgi:hypothetical protein